MKTVYDNGSDVIYFSRKKPKWEKILLKKVYEVKGTPEERLMDFYEFTVKKINQLKAQWEKQERERIVGEIRKSAVKIVEKSRAVFFGKLDKEVDRVIGIGTYEMKAQIFSDLFENEKSPLVFPKFLSHLKEREK